MEDGLSDDAFYPFMDLDSAIYYAVNGTVTSLPDFIQNILNCVPKMNKALWVWNDMGVSYFYSFDFNFYFGAEYSFNINGSYSIIFGI